MTRWMPLKAMKLRSHFHHPPSSPLLPPSFPLLLPARYTVRFGNGEERTGILAAELVVPDKLRLGQQVLAARQRMGYLSRAEIVGYGDLPGVHSTCFEVRFESDGHAQLCPPGDVAVKAFTSQDLTGMAHQSHKCAAPCGLDEVGAPIASPGMIALVDGGYGRGHAIDLGEDSPVGQPPMEVRQLRHGF